jgi:hypothetical protein
MGTRRDILRAALDRADAAVLPAGVAAVSVKTGTVRARLRALGLPFFDPDAPAPRRFEVEAAAERVIAQAAARASAYGGLAGLAGLAGLPAEVGAEAVAALRLAQRLAVLWGFELESERGGVAVWRALAAGFEVSMPEQGPLGARLSELPAWLLAVGPRPRVEAALAGAVVRRTAAWAAGRWARVVPVIGSVAAASDAHARFFELGRRMSAQLARLSEAGGLEQPVFDALVVR